MSHSWFLLPTACLRFPLPVIADTFLFFISIFVSLLLFFSFAMPALAIYRLLLFRLWVSRAEQPVIGRRHCFECSSFTSLRWSLSPVWHFGLLVTDSGLSVLIRDTGNAIAENRRFCGGVADLLPQFAGWLLRMVGSPMHLLCRLSMRGRRYSQPYSCSISSHRPPTHRSRVDSGRD